MKIWFWRILAWGSLVGYVAALILASRHPRSDALAIVGLALGVVVVGAFFMLIRAKRKASTARYVAERRKTDFFLDDERRRFDARAFLDSLHAKNVHTDHGIGAYNRYWFEITCWTGSVALKLETGLHESDTEHGRLIGWSSCSIYDQGDPDSTHPFFVFRNTTVDKDLIWCEMGGQFQVVVPESIFKIWRERAEHYTTHPQENPSTHKESPASS